MSRKLTVSRIIFNIRRSNNLSKVGFGKAIGVTQRCVYNWEHGRRIPGTKYLDRIIQRLDVNPYNAVSLMLCRDREIKEREQLKELKKLEELVQLDNQEKQNEQRRKEENQKT